MTLSSKLVPTSGCLFGAWVSSNCTSGTGLDGRFRTFESETGRTVAGAGLLNIFHQFSWFPDYTTQFPSAAEQSLLDEGRLMLLCWTPKSSTGAPLLWADVANGNYDATYIDPTAAHIRDYGKTIFIAIHTEPDGDMSENGGAFGTAADYVAMHKHIRARFALAGAANTVWVWNTAAYYATMGLQSGTAFNRLYPGDDQIDWLGFDPYSNGETFTQVFGTKHPFVQWSRGTNGGGINKCPALVTPTGVTVVPQGTTGATTYGYRVTALNQQGETLASATVQITNGNATLGATNFNRITWTGQNATYYKVYGRTSGSELLLATVTAPTVTYDDKGTATPSGALPAANTATSNLAMPVMIPEWGVSNWSGRPQYFADFQSALKTAPYNAIKAALYWNSIFTYSVCIEPQPAAVTAYTTLSTDPFYNPDMSPTPPPSASGQYRAGTSVALNAESTKALTVPSTVQAGDQLLLFGAFTRASLRNACEGTNAANITTANSNSAGSNPWDSTSGNPPTYDTSQKHSLTSAMHASVTAGTDAHGDWTSTSFGSPSTYYGRLYYRRSALPTNITRMFQQFNVGGGTNQWGIGLDTAGKIIVRDLPAGATRWTSTVTPAANLWHRVEWQAAWNGTTTTVAVRIYVDALADEITLDDSGTSTAFTQAAAPGKYSFGHLTSVAQTYDLYIDEPALDANNWLGPAGSLAGITDPAGWTSMSSADNVSGPMELRSRLWRKTAVGGDPGATVTVTLDQKVNGSLELIAYSGINSTTPIDQFASSTAVGNATTVTSPNVTTTGAGELIVTAGFDRANPPAAATSAWTAPTGDTLRSSSYGTGTDGRVSGFTSDDGVGHAAGTYGSKVATANATSYLQTGWTVALVPSGASGATQYCGFLVN